VRAVFQNENENVRLPVQTRQDVVRSCSWALKSLLLQVMCL